MVVGLHPDRAARRASAIEALNAGKHVIIEKPAEIDRREDRRDHRGPAEGGHARSRSSRSTGSTRPPRSTLAAIERGELGRLTSGIASIDWWRGQSYYDSGDWRGTWELDGGGALMNQGVHTVDLLIAAMGRPVEVFAYTGTLAHERIEVEDVAVGVVRFESGALGVLHATTAAYPGLSARVQVHGDKGSGGHRQRPARLLPRATTPAPGRRSDGANSATTTRRTASTCPRRGGRGRPRPGPAVRRAPAAVPQLPRRARRDVRQLRVDLETNRQAIAVITGVYESAPDRARPVELCVSAPETASPPTRSRTGPRPGRPREVFEQAFRDFRDDRLHRGQGGHPRGHDAPRSTPDWIGGYGLAPSLSLFSSPFDETVDMADGGGAGQAVRRRRRSRSAWTGRWCPRWPCRPGWRSPRWARTSTRAGCARPSTTAGAVCEVLQAEGLRPLHHSHVGGVFETEAEIVRLLDDLGPDVIGFGPDTGHLRWAGIDPAPFIRRYADRIGGIHIKDCFPDFLTRREPARA